MIIDTFKQLRNNLRHHKADKIRRAIKREILIEDAHEFFAGKKSQQQSRDYRDFMYQEVDKLSDEEILR